MLTPTHAPSTAHDERRAGWRRFMLGMLVYVVAVALQSVVLRPDRFGLPVAVAIALLPMLPAVWAMGGWLRAMRALDELQQRVHVQAALVALGTVAILTFSYGFLEATLGAPRISMFVVWPTIGVAYGIGLYAAQRRWFPREG